MSRKKPSGRIALMGGQKLSAYLIGGLLFLLAVWLPVGRAVADVIPDGYRPIPQFTIVDAIDNPTQMALFAYAFPQHYAAPVVVGRPLNVGSGKPWNRVLIVGIPKDQLAELGGGPQAAWFGSVRDMRLALPRGVVISGQFSGRARAFVQESDDLRELVTHVLVAVIHDASGQPIEIAVVPLNRDGTRVSSQARVDEPVRVEFDSRKLSPIPGIDSARAPVGTGSAGTAVWVGLSGVGIGTLIALFAIRRRDRAQI